jgi:hypothetical protein
MAKPKIDNPLFVKTDESSSSLKVLNSKTLKLKPENGSSVPVPSGIQDQVLNFKTLKVSKFKTFKVQLLARLTEDQLQSLSKLESTIMKGRSSKSRKERITKNSIIRASVDALASLNIDTREIPDEATFLGRIKQAMKTQSGN